MNTSVDEVTLTLGEDRRKRHVMSNTCPICQAELDAADRRMDGQRECPRCGAVVPGEAVDAAEKQQALVTARWDAADAVEPPESAGLSCPRCGVANSATAGSCSDCGEELRGSDDAVLGEGIWRDGKRLVMRKTAELPYRCVKTNQPADGWLKRKLQWHHPAVYLALPVNLLVYAILALCLRQRATIYVGLCQAAFRRRRWTIVLGWVSALGGVALCVVGCAGLNGPESELLMGGLMLVGVLGGIAGTITGMALSSVVTPAKITDEFVWLKGVHADYLKSFPDWPGEDVVSPKRKRRR